MLIPSIIPRFIDPITLPYTSPQSNSFAPSQHQQQQHISSSIDRLPPSVNPLSDPNQDRNSPYPGQLNIDPVLNSTAHPYPLDGPQLAAQAAQLISVENPVSSKELNTSSMTGNTPLSCECCPKKPRRFNSEAELRYVTWFPRYFSILSPPKLQPCYKASP